jgi:hypothetical protein
VKDNISSNVHVHLRLNGPFLFPDFTTIDCDDQIFVKMVSKKFNENKLFPADTRTDRHMTKLRFTVRKLCERA